MTTNNHLNEFTEIDPKLREDLMNTADELLLVEELDLENSEYLAKILFCLGKYDESIRQFERMLSMKGRNKNALASIVVTLLGIVKAPVNPVQPSNALLPILVNVEGSVTEVIEEYEVKASFINVVTPSGITADLT